MPRILSSSLNISNMSHLLLILIGHPHLSDVSLGDSRMDTPKSTCLKEMLKFQVKIYRLGALGWRYIRSIFTINITYE